MPKVADSFMPFSITTDSHFSDTLCVHSKRKLNWTEKYNNEIMKEKKTDANQEQALHLNEIDRSAPVDRHCIRR